MATEKRQRRRSITVPWSDVKKARDAYKNGGEVSEPLEVKEAGVPLVPKIVVALGAATELIFELLEEAPSELIAFDEGTLGAVYDLLFEDDPPDIPSPEPVQSDVISEAFPEPYEAGEGNYIQILASGSTEGRWSAPGEGFERDYSASRSAPGQIVGEDQDIKFKTVLGYEIDFGRTLILFFGTDLDGESKTAVLAFEDLWREEDVQSGSDSTNVFGLRDQGREDYEEDADDWISITRNDRVSFTPFRTFTNFIIRRRSEEDDEQVQDDEIEEPVRDPYFPNKDEKPDTEGKKLASPVELPKERNIPEEAPARRLDPEWSPTDRNIRLRDPDNPDIPNERVPTITPTVPGLDIDLPSPPPQEEVPPRRRRENPIIPSLETERFPEKQIPSGIGADICACVLSPEDSDFDLDDLDFDIPEDEEEEETIDLTFFYQECDEGELVDREVTYAVPESLTSVVQASVTEILEGRNQLERIKCGILPEEEVTESVVTVEDGLLEEKEETVSYASLFKEIKKELQEIKNSNARQEASFISDLTKAVKCTIISEPIRGTTWIAEDQSSTRFPAGWIQFFRDGETYGSRIDIEFQEQVIPFPTLADDFTVAEINKAQIETEVIDWNKVDANEE